MTTILENQQDQRPLAPSRKRARFVFGLRLFRLTIAALAAMSSAILLSGFGVEANGDDGGGKPSNTLGQAVPPRHCSPIDFTSAQLIQANGQVLLKVAGSAPYAGMDIQLRPVLYVMQPDFWLMSLLACTPINTKPGGPLAPFSVEINVGGTVGRKGVELSGAAAGIAVHLELAR